MDKRDQLADEFIRIAEELEKAAAHSRVTGERFRKHDVPRACAHMVACLGHISRAKKSLTECAEVHSGFAVIEDTEG